MKKAIAILAVLLLFLSFSGCGLIMRDSFSKDSTEWMIGKNSEQIQAHFGEFYGHPNDIPEDGLFKDCRCSYKRERSTFSDIWEEYLFIYFDANGIAYKTVIFVDNF